MSPTASCDCPTFPGYTIHRPACPEYALLGIKPVTSATWFDPGTIGPPDDEPAYADPTGEMADRAADKYQQWLAAEQW